MFTHQALLEQIEMLKAVKADKDDIEEALADKADTGAVNRKVSHNQFDAVCDDLSQQLEDAMGKLKTQVKIKICSYDVRFYNVDAIKKNEC